MNVAEKYELAYHDYKAGMKQKDIAAKYDVTINTVKSWQQRKWKEMDADEKVCTPSEKSMHTEKKGARTKESVPPELKRVVEAHEEVTEENIDLTDSQRFFCLYYVKYLNATKAYQKAYECNYEAANASGSRLLAKISIRNEIARLKRERTAGIMLDGNDVLQKYIDIAFSDIGDYLDYGTEEVDLIDEEGLPLVDENGNKRTYQRSYVRFKEGVSLDNTVVSEVKQGKDGVSIKLYDKIRALEFLSKYTDLLDDRTKTQIQTEKSKVDAVNAALKQQQDNELHKLKVDQAELNIQKTKAELEKINDPEADKNFTINFVRKGDA